MLMQAATAPQPVDLKEVGNTIVTLPQDFRLIMYVLIVVIIVMVVERGLSAWGMRKEREDMTKERQQMWAVADKFSEAAKEYSENTDKLVIELQVLRALTARVESDAGRR